eukprot:293676-Pleurochrysis_carterae.AAC.2
MWCAHARCCASSTCMCRELIETGVQKGAKRAPVGCVKTRRGVRHRLQSGREADVRSKRRRGQHKSVQMKAQTERASERNKKASGARAIGCATKRATAHLGMSNARAGVRGRARACVGANERVRMRTTVQERDAVGRRGRVGQKRARGGGVACTCVRACAYARARRARCAPHTSLCCMARRSSRRREIWASSRPHTALARALSSPASPGKRR